MKTSTKRALGLVGGALAWLLLLSGFAATRMSALALKSIPANDPESVLASYSMFYLVPMFCMIVPLLVFEVWACVRGGSLNPWPAVALIYVCISSSLAIYYSMSAAIHDKQDLAMLREYVIGPFPVLRAWLLLGVFGLYVSALVRQASKVPLSASLGRFALFLWLLHFTITRLLRPSRMIDRIMETMS